MKETLSRVWWKVPLYSVVAGYLSFWVMIGPYGRLAHKKLPDGTITSDQNLWTLLSVGVFVAVVLIGGLLVFRKLTRKELLCSATVMFALNVALGILSSVMPINAVSWFFMESAEWYSVLVQLLNKAGLNPWICALFGWAAVYLFVPFGKKEKGEAL